MIRVLYIHQHFSTAKGKVGIRSYQMARKLVQMGHEVTMICGSSDNGDSGLSGSFTSGRREGMVDGIKVIECDLFYSNELGFVRRFVVFMKFVLQTISIVFREEYDILFATSTPLTVGIPGIVAKIFRRKPFVFEVRDLWPELPRKMGVITNPVILRLMAVLEWLSYRTADRLVALSPGIAKGIMSTGVAASKIALVPNGCDNEIYSPYIKPVRPDSVAPGDLMAIFSGTHGIANGLDAILQVARELKKRQADSIKFVLIGGGIRKSELVDIAARDGLDNIIFMEPVAKKELAGYLSGADVGLQILANVEAFYYGTSPNKFFDYIAAGKPVLNNYPGWLASIIQENNLGFAISPDDPVAFADALEYAKRNPAELTEMGRNAKEVATKQFDRDQLADKWAEWILNGK